MKKVTLLQKAILTVLVLLLPIIISFFLGYTKNKTQIKNQILDDITVISEAYEGQVYQFLEMSKRRVQDFSSDGVIREGLEKILQGTGNPGNLGLYLRKNKLVVDPTISRIWVVSSKGAVAASTSPDDVGKDVSGEEFFLQGMVKPSVIQGKGPVKSAELALSAPLPGKKGGITGVIVNFTNISELNNLLKGEFNRKLGALSWAKGRHKTMEVYLVNADGLMLTESIFIKDSILKTRVDTLPVRECLGSKREITGFYNDYRGKEVAGASMCMPAMGWTLLAEIDSDEVLASSVGIARYALIAAIIVSALVFSLFIGFYRNVIRRLQALSFASAAIARGDYEVAVPDASGDEIGILSDSFNRMAGEIKHRTTLLGESEKRLKAIIDNSNAFIFLKDINGKYLLANRRFESLLKMTGDEIIGRTDHQIFGPEIGSRLREHDDLVIKTLSAREFEESVPYEGALHYYISTKVPILDASGKPFAVCGISTDITDRKLAEAKIARLNRLYSVLSRINEAIIRIRDIDKLYEEACRIAVEDGGFLLAWFGRLDPETSAIKAIASWGDRSYLDEIRITVLDNNEGRGPTGSAVREGRHLIVNDIENDQRMAPWRNRALEHGFRSSAALPLKVGQKITGAFSIYSGEKDFFNDEEMKLLDSLLADISFAAESMEHERQRRRTDEELKLLQSISLSISEADDLNAAFSIAIKRVCEATGWSFGEVWVPDRANDSLERASYWLPPGMKKIEQFINSSAKARFQRGKGLPGRVWLTGKPEWVEDIAVYYDWFPRACEAIEAGILAGFAAPILSGKEVPAVLVFFMEERAKEDARLVNLVSSISAQISPIIRRKLAEEEQLELRKRYEELVNNLTVGVYRCSSDGELIEVNRAFIDIFEGGVKENFLKLRLGNICDDMEKCAEVNGKLQKGESLKEEAVPMVTLKGKKLWGAITAVKKTNADGNVFFDGFVEDVTEKRRLEDLLVQSQKMEAVGLLAGGIAHDFNNILTAIIGYANLLLLKKEQDGFIKNYSENILALSEKAASLTRGLLAFSRKQVMNPKPLDLNELVRRLCKILGRLIGEDIDLRVELCNDHITVKADSAQIEQMLMNLFTNARDAMPKGGVLSISTCITVLGKEFVEGHGYGEPGTYAMISVSDTGFGMDEATRKRIFEPFFTTKEVGKGTGLGLSVVYGIIKQHNGFINVYSEPGQGANFKIYLPLTGEKEGAFQAAASLGAVKGGTETILLVEDEDAVRRVNKTLLEEFGYTVIEASNGEEAVLKYKENKDNIGLVVMDLIMPKKSGKEAYEDIVKINPGAKVLFTSGYAAEVMKSKGILEPGSNFLSKPVSPSEFIRKIREAIDR